MVLFVRELMPDERIKLEQWTSAGKGELGHRARVVLLSAAGHRVPEIATLLGSHPANLRKWLHRFNTRGCDGLVTVRAGGAKPRFTETQKRRIIDLARRPPRELGLNFTTWTLHRLAEQAQKRHIVDQISHEYVRQILKADAQTYGQPR
ncbi:MAG: helix-turn-helix domain containing protein [Chloroflexi bacterium]|nr:helix-turn-helix domain containing protein [Chloroflexota bacterium]